MTHPMLERVARAICRGQSWDAFVDDARAAITALREHEIEHVGMVPFLLKMQEYGFGSDQLEVMVGGNPDHRIRPGALKAALADFYTAALDSILSEKSPDNG